MATDHAPFDFHGQKEMGRGDFTKIPNGIPSVQDRVHLLYTHGVATGRIDLHRFVDVASTQAAKLFGLFPRKGTIQPGADADLVVFDPNYRGVISARTQLMNVDYSAFEGWPIQGRVDTVTVRGKVQVRDGRFVGSGNHGRMLDASRRTARKHGGPRACTNQPRDSASVWRTKSSPRHSWSAWMDALCRAAP